jgi:hypothetical protein
MQGKEQWRPGGEQESRVKGHLLPGLPTDPSPQASPANDFPPQDSNQPALFTG